MTKAEKTKQYIIEQTATIFNKKGYAGTSMSDITEATGLTKGSIYGNFQDKDEVALEAYRYNIGRLKKASFPRDRYNSAIDSLLGITSFYRANWQMLAKKGGCPILNASTEADDNLPFMKKHVQASVKDMLRNLSAIISNGQDKGEIKHNVSASEYAILIMTLIEGGSMMAKINNDAKLLFAALDRVDLIIKTEIKN